MSQAVSINKVYEVSEEVVAREIQGELIIIPIAAGIGDMEDAMFTLNDHGKSIWGKFDGKKTLGGIVEELEDEFSGSKDAIKKDVLGFTQELFKKKIIAEKKKK